MTSFKTRMMQMMMGTRSEVRRSLVSASGSRSVMARLELVLE